MPGPKPTYTDEQALSDTWDAIAAYEREVDELIKRAVQNKPGYIDSMTYDAGKRTLTTELQTLQATYGAGNPHITGVGFKKSAQQKGHVLCATHRAITKIEQSTSDTLGTLTLTLMFNDASPQTVTFNVPKAKGPQGKPGEDEKWPASGEVKKSGGTATKYGKNGEKIAEASSAFATGSATGVSASISLASLSATGVSISVTGLSFSWDGVFSSCALKVKNVSREDGIDNVVEYELSIADVDAGVAETKARALQAKLEIQRQEADGLETDLCAIKEK